MIQPSITSRPTVIPFVVMLLSLASKANVSCPLQINSRLRWGRSKKIHCFCLLRAVTFVILHTISCLEIHGQIEFGLTHDKVTLYNAFSKMILMCRNMRWEWNYYRTLKLRWPKTIRHWVNTAADYSVFWFRGQRSLTYLGVIELDLT